MRQRGKAPIPETRFRLNNARAVKASVTPITKTPFEPFDSPINLFLQILKKICIPTLQLIIFNLINYTIVDFMYSMNLMTVACGSLSLAEYIQCVWTILVISFWLGCS